MKTQQRFLRCAAALLGVPVVVCLAVPALGDPDSDNAAFLASLQSAGITYGGSADQVIATAKTVCALIGNGKSGQEVLTVLQNRNPGLTIDHGTKFIAIAARSYCPQQLTPGNPEAPG